VAPAWRAGQLPIIGNSSDICMKPKIVALLMVLLPIVPGCTNAAPTGVAPAGNFAQFLAGVKHDAAAEGVPESVIESALRGVQPLPHVIELDQKQPETTITLNQYLSHVVSPDRIERGRKLKAELKPSLRAVSDRYGVPPKTIMALWAIESSFGKAMGDFRVVDSLATLAFDGRRPDLFRAELISALKILARGGLESGELKGSWAGAMGQTQFMPSTYLKYAVSYRHDGQPDIWQRTDDVFASAANYVATLGWNRHQSWGREVRLPARFDDGLIGLATRRSVTAWGKAGVRRLDGAPLSPSAIEGSIVQPDGPGGRAFLVYDNFRTIMKWNHSTYFALAVSLLGDEIGN
jgi:membrane-bound lytic murein transglycosylase B